MTVLLTGFPGFLASSLLPSIIQRTGESVTCIVQSKYADVASERVDQLASAGAAIARHVRLVEGDITQPHLALGRHAPHDVTEVWHLAAVYDLAVKRDLALRVNVEGTQTRSTSLNGARISGDFTTSVLATSAGGTRVRSARTISRWERHSTTTTRKPSTKPRPRCRRMAGGLPATISAFDRGRRQPDRRDAKFDGPYFIMQWLLRQPHYAALPLLPEIRL